MIVALCVCVFLAGGLLMTFALCRAATRRDETEERWASAAADGQEKEEHRETV